MGTTEMLRCSNCEKTFTQKRYLHRHVQRVHLQPKRMPVGKLLCNTCGKEFPRLSHLHRHQLTHLDIKEWGCPFCRTAFAQKVHLLKHLRRLHADKCDGDIADSIEKNHWRPEEEEPSTSTSEPKKPVTDQLTLKPCECAKCGRTFFSADELKRHEKLRHRRIQCPCCGTYFDGWRLYKRHQMRAREDIHRCEKCKATFQRTSELNTHKSGCFGVRHFLCVACDATFAQRVQLDRHWAKTHFASHRNCIYCGKEEITPAKMKAHIFKTHGHVVCGYCGAEGGSREHVNTFHWARIKSTISGSCSTILLPNSHLVSVERPMCDSQVTVNSKKSHDMAEEHHTIDDLEKPIDDDNQLSASFQVVMSVPAMSESAVVGKRELNDIERIEVQPSDISRELVLFLDQHEMRVAAKIFGKQVEKTVEVSPNSTVRHLRKTLADSFVLPPACFKIVCVGKPLKDDRKTLSDYDVKDETKLTIMLDDKIEASNMVEHVIIGAFDGGRNGALALLRYKKAMEDFIDAQSLEDLEAFAQSLQESSTNA